MNSLMHARCNKCSRCFVAARPPVYTPALDFVQDTVNSCSSKLVLFFPLLQIFNGAVVPIDDGGLDDTYYLPIFGIEITFFLPLRA